MYVISQLQLVIVFKDASLVLILLKYKYTVDGFIFVGTNFVD